MSLFTKASAVERRLKILVYGPWGSGKTVFGLSFRKAGGVAVIDTEGSSDLYGAEHDFYVLHTKDFGKVLQAVAECKADGGKTYKTLVIDPITVLWQILQDAGQQLAENRARKGGTASGLADVVLTQRDWGIIKRQYAKLMTELVNLPLNIVLTARQKDKTDREGNFQGVTFDGEKNTPYIPDIVLRLEGDKDHTAIVEKVRGPLGKQFPVGTRIKSPSYETFAPAISHGTVVVLPDEEQDASATAALLEASEAPARPMVMQQVDAAHASINGGRTADGAVTKEQMERLRTLCEKLGRMVPDASKLTFQSASAMLGKLGDEYAKTLEVLPS